MNVQARVSAYMLVFACIELKNKSEQKASTNASKDKLGKNEESIDETVSNGTWARDS